MRHLYAVRGALQGGLLCSEHWVVAVYEDQDMATEHLRRLRTKLSYAQEIEMVSERRALNYMAAYDPYMASSWVEDITGLVYYCNVMDLFTEVPSI